MSYKWKPSKSAKKEFAQKMDRIQVFCDKHGIEYSSTMDSFYFVLNKQQYRVSNHSVETSKWHPLGRQRDVIYIHASKTRIIDIYNDLKVGYVLDGFGCRKH